MQRHPLLATLLALVLVLITATLGLAQEAHVPRNVTLRRNASTAQAPAPQAETAGLDPERLASLAPRLDSRRTDLRAFEAQGWWGGLTIGFHCVAESPKRACVVAFNGVPAFVAAGDQIFLYDPLYGPRLWRGDWSVLFGFGTSMFESNKDTLTVGCQMHPFGSQNARIDLDIPSIMAHAPQRRSARAAGESRVILTGHTELGGRVDAWVFASTPGKYSRLSAYTADGTAVADLRVLSVDQAIPADAFRFPPFAERLGLAAPTTVTFETLGEGVKQIGAILLIHLGLADVRNRKEVEDTLGQSLDWQQLQAGEATLAPLLRKTLEEGSRLSVP